MAGVPVSVMSAVWKALTAAGVKYVGATEHNAIIAALSPCFTPDYMGGVNGWPLVPVEVGDEDVSPIGDTGDEGPDPNCTDCHGTGFNDADHDGINFIPLRCFCNPV